jgi:hypothetical protein
VSATAVVTDVLHKLSPRDAISVLLLGLVLTGGYVVADVRGKAEKKAEQIGALAARATALEQAKAVAESQQADILRRLESLDKRTERAERAQLEALKFWYERVPGGEAKAREMGRQLARIQ